MKTARNQNEMLRIISEGTASVVGNDFFRSLAYHIIVSTGIRYTIVTKCANIAKSRVRTLVYIEHDEFLDNYEYDLEGTPCDIVMKGENYYSADDLDTLFPKEHGIKGYFGVPIFLSDGEVIGHIAVFDTQPLRINLNQLNILKIFASRAGTEIERKRKNELIHENMIRYVSLFEDSPIGLVEEDFSEVKKFIDNLKLKFNTSLKEILSDHSDYVSHCWKTVKRISVNKAQLKLFDATSPQHYFEYLHDRFQPDPFIEVLILFDQGEFIFERELEIKSITGNHRILKAKRVVLPEAEKNWSKCLLCCVDITEQRNTQKALKAALWEVENLKEKLEAENVYLQQEIKLEHNFEEIVSSSAIFKNVISKISQVAETDATVLVLGESGTGKELIVRGIHSVSKRSHRPLIKVNCAALPASLIESELFGHEKGAFTGAIAQKIGRFELADGGTIFLDEIGELPLDLQSKLLRVLQEGEFERVGSSKTIKINVRVIAATNRDLQAAINNKEFREDLYYRLNVFPIYSPPLRERKEDIPVLLNHFCKKHSARLGKKINSISKIVIDSLMQYEWPGNVRELENIIERGMIVSQGNLLEPGDWLPKTPEMVVKNKVVEKVNIDSASSIQSIEKKHIIEVLEKANWKIRGENGAAKILNLNPTTLEARMKKLVISKPK